MRKLLVLMHVSLDGFTATADGGLEWTFRGMNVEVAAGAQALLSDVDVALYGRQTYQAMYGYWPTVLSNPESRPYQIEHARWVERVSKVVCSTTLSHVGWNNSRLVKDRLAEEINALKHQSGQNLMTFGSPRLVHALMQLGLIDEYRLFLHPVVLGGGIPLFKDLKETMNLKLVESKTFGNGLVHLRYQSA